MVKVLGKNLFLKIQLQNTYFVILTTFFQIKYQIEKKNWNIVDLYKTHAAHRSLWINREKARNYLFQNRKFKKIKNNKKFGICHIFGVVAPHKRAPLHKNKFIDYL